MLTEIGKAWLAWIIDEESTITISNQVRESMTSQAYLNHEPIKKQGQIIGSKHSSKEELEFSEKIYSKIHSMNRKSRGF